MKNLFTWFVLLSLIAMAVPVSGLAQTDYHALDIKDILKERGIGKGGPLRIKLKAGGMVEGYPTEISEESFVMFDEKTLETVTIKYSEVEDVRQLKTKSKKVGIAILVGIAAAVAIFVSWFMYSILNN